MFTVTEILDLAIQLETNGEAVYRDAVRNAVTADAAAMLTWMAEEESNHLAFFQKLRGEADAGGTHSVMEELKRDVFADIMGNKTFSLEDQDLGGLATTEAVLQAALEFEKDTVLFYEILEPFLIDEGARAGLLSIIEEERKHIRRIREYLSAAEEQPA
jgi:rubrerythrin